MDSMDKETSELGEGDFSSDGTDVAVPTDERLYERAHQLVTVGSKLGITFGTAESCTGGLVSGAITAVPGSSEVLRGGVVSYAIPVKHEVLGVSDDILNAPGVGAVSSECAAQMCEGARLVLKCNIAVSITGIAGPGGAEPGKPVGTVWFGVTDGNETHTEVHHFSGNRETVRQKAVWVALGLLLSMAKR